MSDDRCEDFLALGVEHRVRLRRYEAPPCVWPIQKNPHEHGVARADYVSQDDNASPMRPHGDAPLCLIPALARLAHGHVLHR